MYFPKLLGLLSIKMLFNKHTTDLLMTQRLLIPNLLQGYFKVFSMNCFRSSKHQKTLTLTTSSKRVLLIFHFDSKRKVVLLKNIIIQQKHY